MADDRPLPSSPRRVRLRTYLIPVACGFLGTAAVALVIFIGRAASGSGGVGEPAVTPVPVAVTATCQRGPSRDSRGAPTSYEPPRAVDGDLTTAWRCDGDGVGQSITLGFAGPTRITQVGFVPGLAKSDPGDGTDRYAQNRRIAGVRITTDTGGSVEAALDSTGTNRSVQYVSLDGVTAGSVTVTILSSVPGSRENGQDAVDSVAISEIDLR
jgi:hypothetical protein